MVKRIPRTEVKKRRAERVSRDIKALQYEKTIHMERKERFYVNQNKGVIL